MKNLILIIVFLLLCPSLVLAEDRPTLPKSQGEIDSVNFAKTIDEERKERMRNIKVFTKDLTKVYFEPAAYGDAEIIGLDEKKLTDYLRLKVKNNFADIKFINDYTEYYIKQRDDNIPMFKDFKRNPDYIDRENVGFIGLTVWVVGNNYPVAYYIRCTFENFTECNSLMNELSTLGYGSKDNVPDRIKKFIGEYIEKFAIDFYKARGEL